MHKRMAKRDSMTKGVITIALIGALLSFLSSFIMYFTGTFSSGANAGRTGLVGENVTVTWPVGIFLGIIMLLVALQMYVDKPKE